MTLGDIINAYVKVIVVLTPLAFFLHVGCSDSEQSKPMDLSSLPADTRLEMPSFPSDSPESEIIALLQKMPTLPSYSCEEARSQYVAECSEIETIIQRIASYDLDTIRRVIGYFYGALDSGKRTVQVSGFEEKVMMLNRFLFQLPKTVSRDSSHLCAFPSWGWVTVDTNDPEILSDKIYFRWPWKENDSGEWRFVGHGIFRSGSLYRGDMAFDYYRKHFGKRVIVVDRR